MVVFWLGAVTVIVMWRAVPSPPDLMVAPMQLTTPPDWLQVKFPSVPSALSAADTEGRAGGQGVAHGDVLGVVRAGVPRPRSCR